MLLPFSASTVLLPKPFGGSWQLRVDLCNQPVSEFGGRMPESEALSCAEEGGGGEFHVLPGEKESFAHWRMVRQSWRQPRASVKDNLPNAVLFA